MNTFRFCLGLIAVSLALGCSPAPQPQPAAKNPPAVEPVAENAAPLKPPVAPNPTPMPPPAETPPEPLTLEPLEFGYEREKVKYTIPAPAGAKTKRDLLKPEVRIDFGRRFNIKAGIGRVDLKDRQNLPIAYLVDSEVVTQTPDLLLVRENLVVTFGSAERKMAYQFVMNIKLGHRDLYVASINRNLESAQNFHSEAEIKQMMEAANMLALAMPLPDDPAAVFEAYNATVRKDDAGKVEVLQLASRSITDETMKLLPKLADLKELNASDAMASKESLAVIAQLPKLESLNLQHKAIDDSSIEWLSQMKSLKKLMLGSVTKVTPEGLEKLKAALPECAID